MGFDTIEINLVYVVDVFIVVKVGVVLILVDVLVLDAILCIVDNVSRVTHRDSAMEGICPPPHRKGDKWGGTKPTWG